MRYLRVNLHSRLKEESQLELAQRRLIFPSWLQAKVGAIKAGVYRLWSL